MRLIFAALVIAVASNVSAQTVESTIDLSSLGWGALDMPEPIETDGDLSTAEWLIRSQVTNRFRVVAVRSGRLCAGAWFDPRPHPLVQVAVRRVGMLHKLLIRDTYAGSDAVNIVTLITPSCP